MFASLPELFAFLFACHDAKASESEVNFVENY